MRQERDALGDWQIEEEAFYGISTARLVSAITIPGPAFPAELLRNFLRVRQAQAIAFGRGKQWSLPVAAALERAAGRLIAEESFLAEQVRVLPLHGGGVRSLVLNLDEVLANVALLEMGAAKGDYYLLAPLFRLDRGLQSLAAYMTAFHIAMLDGFARLDSAFEVALTALAEQKQAFSRQETVSRLQFQDLELSVLGSDFGNCQESLQRCRRQLEYWRASLIPCWQGPPEVLPVLRELTELELAVRRSTDDFPRNTDLYAAISSYLKNTALALLQFCNRLRVLTGHSREIDLPRLRANTAFSPDQHEFLLLDSISQMGFAICGADAATTAAIQCGLDNAGAYAPLFTVEILQSGQWLTASLQLLSQQLKSGLTGIAEPGRLRAAASPLQAERLIPILGYERAVQVARIAALTEKPVRLVVEKMKLLSVEQLDGIFPSDDESMETQSEIDEKIC